MNELRKFIQRRATPQYKEEESSQRSSPFPGQVHGRRSKPAKPDKDSKKKPTTLDSLQLELREARLQTAQLRQANALLHDQVNSAMVQSHEADAALLLASSQLEGFKVQCQEQAAVIHAYQAGWMPSQQDSEDSNHNHWTQEGAQNLPLVLQCLEKANVCLKNQLQVANSQLEELKVRSTREITDLESQVASLSSEVEALRSLNLQKSSEITEKDSLIHHNLVKLRDTECLLAQARGQLEGQALQQVAMAQKRMEERNSCARIVLSLDEDGFGVVTDLSFHRFRVVNMFVTEDI